MTADDATRRIGKGVTWEELFFDVAFVFALTQYSRLLHHDHDWAGIGLTLILFVPVYWAWGGVTLYTDQRDLGPLDRIGILTLGLGGLLMALTIPGAYGELGVLFVAIYLCCRALLACLALRNHPSWRTLFVGPYGVFLVTGPLLLAGALAGGTALVVLWAAAAVIDLLSPWIARHLVAQRDVQPLHYTHRYGLLIILVLSESVIQVGAVAVDGPPTPARLIAISIAYALIAALWWAYFGYGLPDFRRALENAPDQPDVRRTVLVYGHLLFSFGIVAISVGLADAVPAPLRALSGGMAMLLFGGCALFLLTFTYTHWRIRREIAWRRVGAGAACLLLLPLARHMPAIAAVVILTLVVIAMTTLEELALRRQGGRGRGRAEARPYGDGDQTDRGPVSSD